jgi:transcriptional regulator with XRE-family HTH domain
VDVTGVRAAGSPIADRRELGALLRSLRVGKGWTAEQVAERLLVSPSKMSRLENGQRGASERDIHDLCDVYDATDEQRSHLLQLASGGKQRAWWQPLGLPYSTYVGLENAASSIEDYGLGLIPGLLQTSDYAHAVIGSAVPAIAAEVVEQLAQGRMARQQLLTAGSPPRFDAVIEESVLHRVVGSPAIMQAQMEQLLKLSELSCVALRILPNAAGAAPTGNHKFIILEFAQPTVSDVVYIEFLTANLYLEDPADVGVYKATFERLVELAETPGVTRDIIAATMADYSGIQHSNDLPE